MKKSFVCLAGAALMTLLGFWVFDMTVGDNRRLSEIVPMPPIDPVYSGITSFPGKSIPITEIALRGEAGFFPKGILGEVFSGKDDVINYWYAENLKAAGERSLLDAEKIAEIYRFTWLRSFSPAIIVVLTRRLDEIKITLIELDGRGGFEPGRVARREQKKLNLNQYRYFISALESADYWTSEHTSRNRGRDGAEWIIEARRDEHYHIVVRWSPKEGDFRRSALILLELAGIDPATLGGGLY